MSPLEILTQLNLHCQEIHITICWLPPKLFGDTHHHLLVVSETIWRYSSPSVGCLWNYWKIFITICWLSSKLLEDPLHHLLVFSESIGRRPSLSVGCLRNYLETLVTMRWIPPKLFGDTRHHALDTSETIWRHSSPSVDSLRNLTKRQNSTRRQRKYILDWKCQGRNPLTFFGDSNCDPGDLI